MTEYLFTRYYLRKTKEFLNSLIPEDMSLLDIDGDFLNLSTQIFQKQTGEFNQIISDNNLQLTHMAQNEISSSKTPYEMNEDYLGIIFSLGKVSDLWTVFRNLRRRVTSDQQLVILHINPLYRIWFKCLKTFGINYPNFGGNHMDKSDVVNLLKLNGFRVVTQGRFCASPVYLPLITPILEVVFRRTSLMSCFGLFFYVVARPDSDGNETKEKKSVSIIVPTKNERGHIERIINDTPEIGLRTELIFVDGDSSDGTKEKIIAEAERYNGPLEIKFLDQKRGHTKIGAVRQGFNSATGDILMILDGDRTVPPADLTKFYVAIVEGHGELINGSRLLHQMENGAMPAFNLFGNYCFAVAFSFILNQRLTDTLCGTKVLKKEHYDKISNSRGKVQNNDPFGDFALLVGAKKNNLRIIEIPIKYERREYGSSKINPLLDGLTLFKLTVFALMEVKLPRVFTSVSD